MTDVSFRWGKRLEALIANLSTRLEAQEAANAAAKKTRERRWRDISYRVSRLEAKACVAPARPSLFDRLEAQSMKDRLDKVEDRLEAKACVAPARPSLFDRLEAQSMKDRLDKVEDRLACATGRAFVQGMFVGAAALLAGMFFGLYLFK